MRVDGRRRGVKAGRDRVGRREVEAGLKIKELLGLNIEGL